MIIKFQQGGALPPFVSYLPVMVTPSTLAAPALALADPKKEDLTDKDMLEMLGKLDGLPSDMTALTHVLQNFYVNEQYSPSAMPNTSSISSRYLSVLLLLKIANFNRKEYDEAFNIVRDNGGINEFAISDRGLLFCINSKGDFKLMSVEDCKKQEEYHPLTNSELLELRAYSPSMAYKNGILSVVRNGISMDTVNKYILDIIGKLGSSEESTEGYEITSQGRVIKGLLDFAKAVNEAANNITYDGTVEDLYKYKYLTKDLAGQALKALAYIYNTLPANARTLLKLKTKNNSDEEALSLVSTLVASQIDGINHFEISLEAGKTAKSIKGTKGSGKDDSDLQTSLPLNVMKGIGGYDQPMRVDKGDGISIDVVGQYYQQIKSPKGDPIINTSLLNMLAESGLLSIVKNMNNITFGDQKMSQAQLANITYNNTGLIRAELPINEDGTVRLDILEDFLNALNDIKLLGEKATAEQIGEIYHKYGLDDLLTADGRPNIDKFGAFMVTEGYSSETNGIKDTEYVKRKELSEQEMQLYKDSLTVGEGKDKRVPDVDEDSWWPGDWWGMYDYMYKAAIYIPILNNVNSAVYGADLKLDYDEAVNQEIKYQNFNKVSHLNTTSADVL